MKYRVYLWHTSTSQSADIEQVVRAFDVDDAIVSLMKALDWGYIHAAFACPIGWRIQHTTTDNWRWRIRCPVSEKLFRVKQQRKGPVLPLQMKLL